MKLDRILVRILEADGRGDHWRAAGADDRKQRNVKWKAKVTPSPSRGRVTLI